MRGLRFRIRLPTPKKRFSAWKSGTLGGKRFWRHRVGLKSPPGFGVFTNPKRYIYNKFYIRTTRSAFPRSTSVAGFLSLVITLALLLSVVASAIVFLIALVAVLAAIAGLGLGIILSIAYFLPATRQPILKAKRAIVGGFSPLFRYRS